MNAGRHSGAGHRAGPDCLQFRASVLRALNGTPRKTDPFSMAQQRSHDPQRYTYSAATRPCTARAAPASRAAMARSAIGARRERRSSCAARKTAITCRARLGAVRSCRARQAMHDKIIIKNTWRGLNARPAAEQRAERPARPRMAPARATRSWATGGATHRRERASLPLGPRTRQRALHRVRSVRGEGRGVST
jgi:hypothetical protein